MQTEDEKELEVLRAAAYRFMSDPLEKAFYHVDSILEDKLPLRDGMKALAQALIEIRRLLNR